MNVSVLVIGVGNEFRRDDGLGLAVAAEIDRRGLPGVGVMRSIGEPGSILEAWTGIALTIVVDAAVGPGGTAGRIRRWIPGDENEPTIVSSHSLGLEQTYRLGQALGRTPEELVVFTMDVADVGHGTGLTPAVAAAVPELVNTVLAELPIESGSMDGSGALP